MCNESFEQIIDGFYDGLKFPDSDGNPTKNIYKWFIDFGRSGELGGILVATEKELEKLCGRTIYLGEALGKHSDIYFELEKSDFTKIDANDYIVRWFEKNVGHCGYNLFDYIEEELDEEEDEGSEEGE